LRIINLFFQEKREPAGMHRVVVTGLGVVSPLGCGVETTAAALLLANMGFVALILLKRYDLACQISDHSARRHRQRRAFNPDDWFDPKEQRKVDDFIIYGVSAATEALKTTIGSPTR